MEGFGPPKNFGVAPPMTYPIFLLAPLRTMSNSYTVGLFIRPSIHSFILALRHLSDEIYQIMFQQECGVK